MHRRNFIRVSGVSALGLLIADWAPQPAGGMLLPGPPSAIWVRLDDGMHVLQQNGLTEWTYRDLTIFITAFSNGQQVAVQSPNEALHEVVLQWNYEVNSDAGILGDHWERTYGDIGFSKAEPARKLPWYLVVQDKKNTSCLGVKTGATAICHWQLNKGKLQLNLDTRSGGVGVQLGERKLVAASIVATQTAGNENTFATVRRFCGLLCDHPRLPAKPVYGINDWYFAYGKNSADLILQHTSLLADLATDTDNRPFSVVDAGWAAYSPLLPGDCCWQDDFSRPNENFKDMAKLAGEVKKMGMRPGLWTRPLCAAHNDRASLLLPVIPGRDNPKNPVLDPSISENTERIKRNIALYNEWGYEMVKHDFTTYDIWGKWGFEMKEEITTKGWRFNDISRTTAEIMLALYKAIREAAGDMYLIGCNTISHLSAGIFELNRIGDDTSGHEWVRTKKMGVNTMAFRMPQHNRFYSADGDCVGLTKKVPWEKNKQWMQLLAESSSPLFISAQPDAVGPEQKQFIRTCFSAAAKEQPVAEPVDWLTNPWPVKWKLNNRIVQFNWD